MFHELSNSFVDMEKMCNAEAKIKWFRSQIIGHCVEFGTPFGKRLLTYADHTASGRSLQCIENTILHNVLPVYGNTHTEDSFVGHITGRLVHDAETYVKACMGGTDNEAILFCGSGSTAAIKRLQEVMSIAVPSNLKERILGTLETKKRWVVFVGPYEHHSNLLTWRQSLAEVVEIPLTKEGTVNLGILKAALQDPIYNGRPKLGSFSACSNVTGILTDTRLIAKILHSNGAFACFDFAACAPYVKIDMQSGRPDSYDAVFVSTHKFMGGPGTPGILLMSKALYLLKNGPPSTCGGGTVDFVNSNEEDTLYVDSIESREDAGTPAIVQKIRAALAFGVKELLTTELILSREFHFIETAIARLSKNANIQIYGTTKAKRIAIMAFGILTTLPSKNAPASPYREEFPHRSVEPLPETVPVITPDASPFHRFFKNSGHAKKLESSSGTDANSSRDFGRLNPFANLPQLQAKIKKASAASSKGRTSTRRVLGKPLDGRFVTKLLNDLFGIQGRGGCSCAATYGHSLLEVPRLQSLALRNEIRKGYSSVKPGWARISFGFYLSDEEFEFILSAVEFIADFGVRFLHLYNLDWKTGDWTLKEPSKWFLEIMASVKRQISGENESMVPFSTQLSGYGYFLNSPALRADLFNARLTSYLNVARLVADHLPQNPVERTLPEDLEETLLTFSV